MQTGKTQQKTAQKQINMEIANSKKIYKKNVEGLFKTNRSKDGIKNSWVENSATYLSELISFFARFEGHDFSEACNDVMTVIRNRADG